MKIFINDKEKIVSSTCTLFEAKNLFKTDADVVIVNGFPTLEDIVLNENDRVTLIKKGEIPKEDELESLLISRHTLGVYEKFKKGRVAIVGLGGLGSSVAISLARSGVGTLLLVDYDVVEPSNLNRQHYFIKQIGKYKTEALEEIINEINPFIKVIKKTCYLNNDNMIEILGDFPIVVEAFDDPKCKANLANYILTKDREKYLISASGMAGNYSCNSIKTTKLKNKFYIVGDRVSECKEGQGLMAPRVSATASHQSNMVLRLLLDEEEV